MERLHEPLVPKEVAGHVYVTVVHQHSVLLQETEDIYSTTAKTTNYSQTWVHTHTVPVKS